MAIFQFNGITKSGFLFQRITPTAIYPAPGEILKKCCNNFFFLTITLKQLIFFDSGNCHRIFHLCIASKKLCFFLALNVSLLHLNQPVIPNRAFNLTCTVQSAGPFKVQWSKNGVDLNRTKYFS